MEKREIELRDVNGAIELVVKEAKLYDRDQTGEYTAEEFEGTIKDLTEGIDLTLVSDISIELLEDLTTIKRDYDEVVLNAINELLKEIDSYYESKFNDLYFTEEFGLDCYNSDCELSFKSGYNYDKYGGYRSHKKALLDYSETLPNLAKLEIECSGNEEGLDKLIAIEEFYEENEDEMSEYKLDWIELFVKVYNVAALSLKQINVILENTALEELNTILEYAESDLI